MMIIKSILWVSYHPFIITITSVFWYILFASSITLQGCRVKDHIVGLTDSGGDGDGTKTAKTSQQRVYEDLLARRDVICVQYQRASEGK